jgi:uroporphyrinogen-III synthase
MTSPVVLNTRPREQAVELSRLLREAGFDVLEAPAIEFTPAWDPAEMAQVRETSYAWLVLPSQNAGKFLVDGLASASGQVGFPENTTGAILPLDGARVLCGRGTANALGLDGPNVTALARFSAQAALDWLRPRLQPNDRVLVPRAADGREELIDGLRAISNVRVDAPICYRTGPAGELPALRQRLQTQRIDVATFCSPSAVEALHADVVASASIVCLGTTTAEAAAGLGLRVAAVAERTSMASLVDAVQDVVAQREAAV